jgi:hypothetical protein
MSLPTLAMKLAVVFSVMFCEPDGEMLTVSGFTVILATALFVESALDVAVTMAVQVPVMVLDCGAV